MAKVRRTRDQADALRRLADKLDAANVVLDKNELAGKSGRGTAKAAAAVHNISVDVEVVAEEVQKAINDIYGDLLDDIEPS